FRLLGPSIRSVWLYPILYSILALPLAYAAVRKYGSRSFSLAYLGFLALGFWPILVSRFSIDIELCLVWEYLALAAFSSIWRAWDSPRGPGAAQACFLGLVTGLGWYTSKFWLPCLGLAVVTIGAYGWGRPKAQGMRWWSLFMGSLFLCVSPLLAALASQDFFSHLHSIFVLQPHADPITPQPFFTLSYLTAPFWGIPDYPFFTFGPFLGGFFNPLVTTLFWLGLLELFSSRRARGRWAVLLVGVFFFAPLLFTQSLEMIRICIALPFLLFPVAMGFQTLLAGMKAPGQKWACGAIFGLSLALDMFHLWVGYGAWAVPENTQGRSKSALAYQVDGILRKAQHPPGPGLIMTDFIPDAFDQTLRAGTYALNALIDPAWSPRQATWACVWVRREYEDYLRRLFPGSRVYRLERVETLENGATSLFLIPINDQNRPLLLRWGKFHEALRPIYGMGHPHDPAKARYALSRLYPLVKNDPFLRSIFWWKWVCLADFQPDYIDNQDVLEKFIIPQAREPFWRTLISYTYYNLGMCYGTRRDLKDARLMLAKANLYDPQLVPLQAEAKAMAYMVLKLGGTPPSPALP
ncbi:MAG TPA: hypothetical protein VFR02_07880, partial [bacterium]|nr:hypothetical protein [bacterium]